MTNENTMAQDYLRELLQNMNEQYGRLVMENKDFDRKLDKILSQTTKTNGRVDRLEDEVFGHTKKKNLQPLHRDPKVIQIGVYIALALLLLVAAATKFDIGSYL